MPLKVAVKVIQSSLTYPQLYMYNTGSIKWDQVHFSGLKHTLCVCNLYEDMVMVKVLIHTANVCKYIFGQSVEISNISIYLQKMCNAIFTVE